MSTATASQTPAAPAPADKKEDKVMSLSAEDETKPLKLISKDKQDFTVERKQAFVSMLVKTCLENDDSAVEVPIPGVTGSVLKLVVQYMVHHKGIEPQLVEKPLRSKIMKDVCADKWDAEYIDTIGDSRQQLYDLILAANYMDIKSLLHLGCAKVASLIKGQPLEKIKEILDPKMSSSGSSSTVAASSSSDKKDEKKEEKKDGDKK
jgi:S-phase kinase-associated protein 1